MAAEPSKWNVAPGANADCNDIAVYMWRRTA